MSTTSGSHGEEIDAEALFFRWTEAMAQKMGQDNIRVLDLFRQFDANGDGTISRTEFRRGVEAANLNMTKKVSDVLCVCAVLLLLVSTATC